MSMNVGPDDWEDDKPMSEINTTPLVDVMLVMLIIFLITIPVITQSVKVELPKAANIPTQTKPENINIAVDREGNMYWNTSLSCTTITRYEIISAPGTPVSSISRAGAWLIE